MSVIELQLTTGLLWIIGCTVAFFLLLRGRVESLPGPVLAVAAALLLRLVPALVLPRGAGYEMHVFQLAATVTRAGESVYLAPIAHPYLPLQIYWMALAEWLTEEVGLFFVFWLKLDSILLDTALVGLVYLAVRRHAGDKPATEAGWLYAVNPVTILVVAYQGQFEAIPLLFLMLAWYLLTFGRDTTAFAGSAIALGLGILSKTWPVLFLPIALLRIARWRRRFLYALMASAVPMVGILTFELFFQGSAIPIVRRALTAGAIPGWWGYSSIMNVAVQLEILSRERFLWLSGWAKSTALLVAAISIWLTRRRAAQISLLVAILVLFAAVPNLGLQGLSWVVPIALIAGRRNQLGWYVAAAVVHMVISYWGLHFSDGLLYRYLSDPLANATIQLSSLIPWLVILYWVVQELTQRAHVPILIMEGGKPTV
jgi:hypothetical protein